MSSVPSYAVVLAVVAVVIVLGLPLALLYYWRKRTVGRMLLQEPPVLDTEQLREAPASQSDHVHLPEITISSAKVINSKQSPSIFARGNILMEVLYDNDVKSSGDDQAVLASTKESTPVRNPADIPILVEKSPTPKQSPYIGNYTQGYLSTQDCTQADASTAGLRGSWYSQKGSYFSFSEELEEDISQEVQIYSYVDPVDSSQLITDAVEEGMGAKSNLTVADGKSYKVITENENVCLQTKSEIILSIENENYVDEVYDIMDRVENVEESEQECSVEEDDAPQFKSPSLPIAASITPSVSAIPCINIAPTSDEKPLSPLTHVSCLSNSTLSLKPLVSIRTLPITESALSVSSESINRSGATLPSTPLTLPTTPLTLPSTPLTGISGYNPVYKEKGSSIEISKL